MASWHTLGQYIHSPPSDPSVDEVWRTYNLCEAVVAFLVTLFVLWPAMRMTEQMESMKETINRKMKTILKSRMHVHSNLILENMMSALTLKQKEQQAMNGGLGAIAAMTKSQTNMYPPDDGGNIRALKRSRSEGSQTDKQMNEKKVEFGEQQAMEMWDAMIKHSKEERALEILSRLKYLCQRHSCYYTLLGMKIDRSIIKSFIAALIVTNIFSYLW